MPCSRIPIQRVAICATVSQLPNAPHMPNVRPTRAPIPNPILMICQQKEITQDNLIIPFLVEVIDESILVVISAGAAASVMTKGDAAVASARGEEAGAGGGEDYEHVLQSHVNYCS